MEVPLKSVSHCKVKAVIRFFTTKKFIGDGHLVSVYGEKCMGFQMVHVWQASTVSSGAVDQLSTKSWVSRLLSGASIVKICLTLLSHVRKFGYTIQLRPRSTTGLENAIRKRFQKKTRWNYRQKKRWQPSLEQ